MTPFAALRSSILESVTPALIQQGFKLNKQALRFTRVAESGAKQYYLLLIKDSAPYIQVNVHLATRLDIVEDIFHRTSGFEKKYQAGTYTMGGALHEITGRSEFNMRLDAKQVSSYPHDMLFSDDMQLFYNKWYERFSSLRQIDEELNDDPERDTLYRAMSWFRCSTGIIVARLVSRADYVTLAQKYTQTMETASGGFYLQRFEKLLNDLNNFPGIRPQ